MTITVTPKSLLDGLARVKPAIDGWIRLVSEGHELCVTADNMTMRIATLVPIERRASKYGEIDTMVPGSLLARIAATHKIGGLRIGQTEDGRLSIGHTESSWMFTGDYDWRPECNDMAKVPAAHDVMGRPHGADVWKVPGDVLRSMRHASFIAGTDESRPVLERVHVNPNGQVAATDSFRLFVAEHIPTDLAPSPVNVPATAIGAIPVQTDEILVTWADRYMELACDSVTTITVRPNDGDFPDYSNLIPMLPSVLMEFDHAAITRAVRMMKTMLTGAYAPMRVTVGRPKVAILDAVVPDEHATTVRVDGAYIAGAGKEIRFALDPAYVLDAIKAIDSPTIRIGVTDNLKPVVITNPAGNPKVFVMPVRIA